MGVSVATYEQLALEDGDDVWELDCGRPRRKPPMTQEHETVASRLAGQLWRQIDDTLYEVRQNAGRVEHGENRRYVPDVYILPRSFKHARSTSPGALESYAESMPFVAEVWSPSTGDYDVDTKLPAYRERGDLEIWRIHPYDNVVTAWRRAPNGSYSEHRWSTGHVTLAAIPLRIDLDRLFAD